MSGRGCNGRLCATLASRAFAGLDEERRWAIKGDCGLMDGNVRHSL